MALRVDVVTLFPGFFQGPLEESILKRAREKGQIEIRIHNLRKYTHDVHRTVDDKPFGGGAGMIIKPEPVYECLEDIRGQGWVVMLTPHGRTFDQAKALEFSRRDHIVLLAGHYEGFDYRIHEHLVDEEVSIGNFITMGGEAPALCVIEAIVRLVPGVLGNSESLKHESFDAEELEYPQYTRPRNFRSWEVPEVLVSGNHKEVEAWRRRTAKKITQEKRADLTRSKP